jgi:hypothetical protein
LSSGPATYRPPFGAQRTRRSHRRQGWGTAHRALGLAVTAFHHRPFHCGSTYVDNGRDGSKAEVHRAREARARGAAIRVVDPDHAVAPLASSGDVQIRPLVPRAWPPRCEADPNECSIGLRIDFCRSSVLFTGDAEHDEEAMVDPGSPVSVLQVAHHGSDTSTTPGFLAKARPRYAVISAGKPGQGLNREYCHPRAIIVRRLTRVLGVGSPPNGALKAASSRRERCRVSRCTPFRFRPKSAGSLGRATSVRHPPATSARTLR